MDPLSTAVLQNMLYKMFKFQPFFLRMFFPSIMTFDTESVEFDKMTQSGKLAPLVSPNVAGKANRKRGHVRKSITPAYVKELDIVKPKLTMKRLAGEKTGGEMTMAQRRQWWITHLLAEQGASILRREEWMAVEAVLTGSIVLSGEDYEEVTIDFGRSPENNITLAGASKWDQVDKNTYDPTEDIEEWAMFASGPVNIAVMDKECWKKFIGFKAVKDLLKTDSGSRTTIEAGPKDLGMVASYKGTFGADLEIWVYKGEFELANGSKQPFLPAGTLVLGHDGYQGVRGYGAIQDAEANASGVIETDRHASNWFTKNPSVENLMTQSAPVMVTEDADGFVVVKTLG